MKRLILALFLMSLFLIGIASAKILKFDVRARNGAVNIDGEDLIYSIKPSFSMWMTKNSEISGLASLQINARNEEGKRILLNVKMKPKNILHLTQNRIHIENEGTADYWRNGERKKIYLDVEYDIDRKKGLVDIKGESEELDFEVNDMIADFGLLDDTKKLNSKYKKVNRAVKDGYVSTSECIETEAGAMGIHYIKPELFDCFIDELEPEILLYVPDGDSFKLAGVEYFIPSFCADETPLLFGQEMNGPMPGHAPGQPEHYDLHAWLYEENPSGMFSEFNPRLSC